jgi:hypothetical protein
MMTRIMQIVSANGWPTTEKSKTLESYFNIGGLDEQEKRVGRLKRLVRPPYLVEPPNMEGTFEENHDLRQNRRYEKQ